MNLHSDELSMPVKLIFSVLILMFGLEHPFHVSVMDAEYNMENGTIQVSHRLFLDDLEDGLKDFHGIDYVDTVEPENEKYLDSLIAKYLQNKVFFVIDGEEKAFKYFGSELEGDARWCYYEVGDVKNLKQVEITNVALMDVFDDQQNIIHLKAKGKIQSYKLDRRTKVKTFSFND